VQRKIMYQQQKNAIIRQWIGSATSNLAMGSHANLACQLGMAS